MSRLTQIHHGDTIVIDTETGDLYEVFPTKEGYVCRGIDHSLTLILDFNNYRKHFDCNLFKYCNYG